MEGARTAGVNGSFTCAQEEVVLSKEDVLVRDLLGAVRAWALAGGEGKGAGPGG
jgi:hypothetical protein